MFQVVLPERAPIAIVAVVARHQVEDMTRGWACPCCACGLVEPSRAICRRCEDESRAELEDSVDGFLARLREERS